MPEVKDTGARGADAQRKALSCRGEVIARVTDGNAVWSSAPQRFFSEPQAPVVVAPWGASHERKLNGSDRLGALINYVKTGL